MTMPTHTSYHSFEEMSIKIWGICGNVSWLRRYPLELLTLKVAAGTPDIQLNRVAIWDRGIPNDVNDETYKYVLIC